MSRGKRAEFFEGDNVKIIMYIAGIVLAISTIVFIFVFLFYNDNANKAAERSLVEMGIADKLVPNNTTTQASITEDKNVEQSSNIVQIEKIEKEEKQEEEEKISKADKNETEVNEKIEDKDEANYEETEETNSNGEAEKKDDVKKADTMKIEAPVSGEIIMDYAEDTLVYSNTLDEWTTHLGIDIKANRTTVVKASADGVVESIKNDPRYGLTVIIDHNNGFKTVYSNLLTAEYVAEGEEVKTGQTIGTIGESAAFEISDDSHLHFEVLKDNKNVNPTIYMK